MSEHWFFLSYARRDAIGNRYVARLHQQLAQEVGRAAGLPGDHKVLEVTVVAEAVGPMHVHAVAIDGSEDFAVDGDGDGCSDTYLSVTPDESDPTMTAKCVIKVAFQAGRGEDGEGPRTATLQVKGGTDEADDILEVEVVACEATCEEPAE